MNDVNSANFLKNSDGSHLSFIGRFNCFMNEVICRDNEERLLQFLVSILYLLKTLCFLQAFKNSFVRKDTLEL